MKKSFIALVAICCTLMLAGCSSGSSNKNESDERKNTTQKEVKKKEEDKTIQIGSVISTDNYELTLQSVELSYDVLPPNTESIYTHYPADPGQVYIYVKADVKNNAKQALSCDEIYSIKADYNNGFSYDSQAIVRDADGSFTYANITQIAPLQTLGVDMLIDCPEEV